MADRGPGSGEQTPRSTSDGARLECAFQRDTFVAVRHEVHSYARAAGLTDPRLYNFVAAVSEIMTNVVQHGGGAGELRAWTDSASVYCRIADRGRGLPAGGAGSGHYRPKPGMIGGWGIWLARQMCDRMSIDTSRSGTTVTLESGLRSPAVGTRGVPSRSG
jgi:serine/threonine-protein kinase RsbW